MGTKFNCERRDMNAGTEHDTTTVAKATSLNCGRKATWNALQRRVNEVLMRQKKVTIKVVDLNELHVP